MAKPIIFLSWSKESGRQLATALGRLFEGTLPSAEAFISTEDIESGAPWDVVIDAKLKLASFGVICVTADNISSPWLNYEAGALATRLEGRTAPYLLGLEPDAIKPYPFSRLQAVRSDRRGTCRLVEDVNRHLGEAISIPIDRVHRLFGKCWDEYETEIGAIKIGAPPPPRPDPSESTAQILASVRNVQQQVAALASGIRHSNRGALIIREEQLAKRLAEVITTLMASAPEMVNPFLVNLRDAGGSPGGYESLIAFVHENLAGIVGRSAEPTVMDRAVASLGKVGLESP
jgi:hypothetical protein